MKPFRLTKNSTFISILLCFFTAQIFAQSDFDSHKPNNMPDHSWGNLKEAVLEAKLLPEDVVGDGGQNSNFGQSISIDGARAAIGAPGMLAHGVVYIFEFDGTNWNRTARIVADDAEIGDKFGNAVSLEGDRLLIANWFDKDNGSFAGAAYIFELEAGVWVQKTRMTASDIGASYNFGLSVSLLGEKALIGARGANNVGGDSVGAAYLFQLVSGNWIQTDKLLANDGEDGDEFGASVYLDFNRAIIGALRDDDVNTNSGAAYIFDYSAGSWSQTIKLTTPDSKISSYFGSRLKLDGDRAVVTASSSNELPGVFSVSTYVYELIGGVWTFSAKLVKNSSTISSGGNSIDISGDTIIVGSLSKVYMFKKIEGVWTESSNFTSLDAQPSEAFGSNIGFSGNNIFVGSYLDEDNGYRSGSAYIFNENMGSWNQSYKLLGDSGGQDNNFGFAVRVSGNIAIIGVPHEDDNGNNSGAAYIYELKAGVWQQTAKLIASDGGLFHNFGYSVDVDGERVVVTSPNASQIGGGSGAVYIYEKDLNGIWSEIKVIASDGTNGDRFGSAVSLDGDRLIVGVPGDDENGAYSGSAYIFELIGGSWTEVIKLLPIDSAIYDYFGWSVSINNHTAIVSAKRNLVNSFNSGAVYVYEYSAGSWSYSEKLSATISYNNLSFGNEIDLEGSRIAIGSNGGSYIFDYSEGSWSQTQKLSSSADSVSLNGDVVLLARSTNYSGGIQTGGGFVYEVSNGIWYQTAEISPSDGIHQGLFGRSVSLDGDIAFIGAYQDDDLGYHSGSIYVYDIDIMPDTVANNQTIEEDANATVIDVLANDTDVDGGPMGILSVTQPVNGFVANYNTNLSYTPDENYCNTDDSLDTFTYTLNGGSTTTVSVRVNCVDDRPLTFGDFATVTEDADFVLIDVLANDTDVDGGPKNIIEVSQPTNGTVVNNTSSLSYKPNLNYCNSDGLIEDTFDYSLNGGSTSSVFVTVNCEDDSPVAVDNVSDVDEDAISTIIDVLANDTDVDGGPINIIAVSQPANGTTVNNSTSVSYMPDPNYCNSADNRDTFTYTLKGGSFASVSILVQCIDDLPIAVDNISSVYEDDVAIILDVLTNDTDIDAGPKTIEFVSQPENGTIVNNTNNLTYTPNENYCNDGITTDDFIYRLNGGSQANVSVEVNCVNDQPSFQLLCDVDATDVIGAVNNQVQIQNFAHAISLGPKNENLQGIQEFLSIINDPSSIINQISLNQQGLLDIEFSLNYGVATIDVTLQDDGGTDFGGNDTSIVQSFNVVYTDYGLDNELIYKNGFDIGCGSMAFILKKATE